MSVYIRVYLNTILFFAYAIYPLSIFRINEFPFACLFFIWICLLSQFAHPKNLQKRQCQFNNLKHFEHFCLSLYRSSIVSGIFIWFVKASCLLLIFYPTIELFYIYKLKLRKIYKLFIQPSIILDVYFSWSFMHAFFKMWRFSKIVLFNFDLIDSETKRFKSLIYYEIPLFLI